MAKSKYGAKLKKFNKSFNSAKERAQEEGGFGGELPDGKYVAQLTKCTLDESQSSGRLQVAMIFKVLEGEYEGETTGKYAGIETEDDQVWLYRLLRRFGIQLDDLEEIEDVIKLLDDQQPEVKISIKSKDSGSFCYVDKLLSELDIEGFETDEEEDEEYEEEDQEEEEDEEDPEGDGEEEEEDEEDPEGDEDLDVGMEVAFTGRNDKEIVGKVTKVLEEEGQVKIKSGTKTYTVDVEDIYIPEEEEEEEEETPVKKKATKKKTAKKKTASKKKTTKKKTSRSRR